MRWSDVPFDPPAKTLRQFAALWLLCFGGFALWQGLARGHLAAAIVLATLAMTIGPLGLFWPGAIRPIYVGWMVLAFPIGWTVSRLILAVLFFGVFTPVALVFRMIGRDALARGRRTGVETYWTPKPAPANASTYFHQF